MGEFKENMYETLHSIKNENIYRYRVPSEYFLNILCGKNGKHLEAMKMHCNLLESTENAIDLNDQWNIQQDATNKSFYIGVDKKDKLIAMFDDIISKCIEIKLTPKQWQWCRKNKALNMTLLPLMFPKSTLSLDSLHGDRLLLYASKQDIIKILHKIQALDINV